MGEVAIRGPSFRSTLVVSVAFAVFAALLVIPYPFAGDQALFAVFARMMQGGAVLYADVWDVKQPGIFWFFQAAGSWAGVNEIAVHTVEALYWIGASVLVALSLRGYLRSPWVAGMFPLLAAGFYFIAASPRHLTQVEPLISMLVVGVLMLLSPHLRDRRAAPLIAGLIAGVVASFKLLAFASPVLIAAVSCIHRARTGEDWRVLMRSLVVPFTLGATIPILALGLWVVSNGLTDVVWFTWFEYPLQVLEVFERSTATLFRATVRFTGALAPVIALAAFRLVNRVERGRNLSVLAAAAVASGLVLILIQTWWTYFFFLLIGPLAVLAVQGIDDLLERRRHVLPAFAVVLALAVPAMYLIGSKSIAAVELIQSQDLEGFRSQQGEYLHALNAVQAVEIGPGTPIYVLGNPLIIFLSGAEQSIPVNGWSPEAWTPDLWRQVARDLERGDTKMLYVSDELLELIRSTVPWFEDQIMAEYELEVQLADGMWFSRLEE